MSSIVAETQNSVARGSVVELKLDAQVSLRDPGRFSEVCGGDLFESSGRQCRGISRAVRNRWAWRTVLGDVLEKLKVWMGNKDLALRLAELSVPILDRLQGSDAASTSNTERYQTSWQNCVPPETEGTF